MKPAQYDTGVLNFSDLEKIDIPKFQRGFVWNSKKKNEFIETLHNGFPFGSLLVYPESEETGSRLILLDGQQRLSTIREYEKNSLKFWKLINQEEFSSKFEDINELLTEDEKIDEIKFSSLIQIQEDRVEWLDDLEKEPRKAARKIIEDIDKSIKEYLDLNSLKLPVITFKGRKEQIAEVFANLNKGGIPLTKYQIFDAAWVHTDIELPGQPIATDLLNLLFEYYDAREKEAEFEFRGPTHAELMENRKITLSELCIAIGYYV